MSTQGNCFFLIEGDSSGNILRSQSAAVALSLFMVLESETRIQACFNKIKKRACCSLMYPNPNIVEEIVENVYGKR
jgi:hypothetical protein